MSKTINMMSKLETKPPYCAVYGCSTNSLDSHLALFRFPKHFERAKVWMKKVGRIDLMHKSYNERRICSLHFNDDDIDLSKQRKRLRSNAIPIDRNISSHIIPEFSVQKVTSANGLETCSGGAISASESTSVDLSNFLEIKTEAEDSSDFLTISHEPSMLRNYLEKPLFGKLVPVKLEFPTVSNESSNHQTSPQCLVTKPVDGILDTSPPIPIEIKPKLEDIPVPVSKKLNLLTGFSDMPSIKRLTIKRLTNETARQNIRSNVADFNSILEILKYHNLVETGNWDRLKELCEPITERITNNTISKCLISKPQIRSLLLNLNFYSPKAYNYVRNRFIASLPLPMIFCSWYKNIGTNPGFTSESFDIISKKVDEMKKTGKHLYFNLVFGEMAIKSEIEWTGTKSVGFIDAGDGTETTTAATLIFVIMVVCVTGSWKIPIGFFTIKSMSAEQKANILIHSIHAVYETGARLVGVTFDGCLSNISTAKLLGCGVNLQKLDPTFTITGVKENFLMLIDSVHMIKLIRNTLVERGPFIDRHNRVIDWNYLKILLELLETTSVDFLKLSTQRIKLMFASQILSNSAADALEYCNHKLKIERFKNSEGTVNFIRICNKVFSILNSRQKFDSLGSTNYKDILFFSIYAINYFSTLKLVNGQLLVESPYKTGFIGIILGLKTIPILRKKFNYWPLTDILFYKFRKDHIENFFELIRRQFHQNSAITVRQFIAAYRKLTVNNCLPLVDLPVLQQNKNSSIKFINSTILNKLTTNDEDDNITDGLEYVEDLNHLLDLDYHTGNRNEYQDYFIIYIAGLVVFRLQTKLKCEECIKLLESNKCCVHHGSTSLCSYDLVKQNSRGKLKIAAEDVLKICSYTEKILKQFILIHNEVEVFTLDKHNYARILIESQNLCRSRLIFTNSTHIHNNCLIRATIEEYLSVRHTYLTSKSTKKIAIIAFNLI